MISTVTRQYSLSDRDLIMPETGSQYVLRVKDLPNEEHPREKMAKLGSQHLTVAELVAVVWGVSARGEDVLALARRTLKEYGEKAISSELNANRLAEAADIPLTKACQIIASFELGRRFYGTGLAGRPAQVRNAKQAYHFLKNMDNLQKEKLRGLYLNSRYQIIHDEVISVGSLTSNIIHPREVFQPAIERGAAAIIIAHNHPSGRLDATMADIEVTEQLIAAGNLHGIELLDHLVIAVGKYTSVFDFIKHS